MGAVSGITSIVSGVGGMVQANQAQKQAKGAMNNARNEKKRLQAELESLENSRQPIINPYANVNSAHFTSARKRLPKLSITMPSLPAKNANIILIKCCSSLFNFIKSLSTYASQLGFSL